MKPVATDLIKRFADAFCFGKKGLAADEIPQFFFNYQGGVPTAVRSADLAFFADPRSCLQSPDLYIRLVAETFQARPALATCPAVYNQHEMSRLRRIALHSRLFFVTANLLRNQRPFTAAEFAGLAAAVEETRQRVPLALCGYCFMPDHVHLVVFPYEGTTISELIRRFKLGAFQRFRHGGSRRGPFWQSRFYDHALRTRREFDETLEYMHQNPVRKGLVEEPEAWRWSSARWFVDQSGPVSVDIVRLPFDSRARI